MRLPPRCLHDLSRTTAIAALVLVTGCATKPPPIKSAMNSGAPASETPRSHPPAIDEHPNIVPVARQGRYTLVEMRPDSSQRDLMLQVINVTIPASIDASVGGAMQHVLLRTGYRLCEAQEAAALYALPLPAAHLRLGPLALRDALATMAGPAWALVIDDFSRQVCFQLKSHLPLPAVIGVEPISGSEARP